MPQKINPFTGKFDFFKNVGLKGDTGAGIIPGGTTDQVLAKNSNTDFDMKWVDMGGYTLPTASASVLGGIKVGSRLSITDGVLSADATDLSAYSTKLQADALYAPISVTQYTDALAVTAIKADASWNATNWDTAYSWGNHASAGYVTGTPWTSMGYYIGDGSAFAPALGLDDNYVTDAEKTAIGTIGDKVDKVLGKGLSTEDYTTTEKTKLSGIEAGAEVNNISDINATDLTDGGETTLHSHAGGGYTDEEAQDAVGGILTNTGNVQFTYDDVTPKITASVDLSGYSVTTHNHDLAYLGITAKASDSDKLDGHDTAYFEVAGAGASAVSSHEGTYNHTLIATALQSETDPVFTAWDKSTGISITKSQVSDFGTYAAPLGLDDNYVTDAEKANLHAPNSDNQIVPTNEAGTSNNFLTAYNSTTGAFSKAQPTWANIDKTTSSIADIATRSHTALTDIGTLTHATIDSYLDQAVKTTSAVQFARIGVGVAPDANRVFYSAATSGTSLPLFERPSLTTNDPITCVYFLSTKTTDMGDGFGITNAFQIKDNAGTANTIGVIGFVRAGADNTGDFVVRNHVAGTQTERFRVSATGTSSFAGSLTVSGGIVQEDWNEVGASGKPAFANSWANFASGYTTAAYMKDSMGFVHIKGMIKSGTIGQAAFTLPTGYRPADTHLFVCISSAGGAEIIGRVDIASDGTVKPLAGGNTWFSFGEISFKAA